MEKVHLSLRVRQKYPDQDPDYIKQEMDGILDRTDGGWLIRYKEVGEGMEGVHTRLHLKDDCIKLERTGSIQSVMLFQKGKETPFVYGIDVGTMDMIIHTEHYNWEIQKTDGKVNLKYSIGFHGGDFGNMDFHLTIKRINKDA